MIPGITPGSGGMQKKEVRSILIMVVAALVLLILLIGLLVGNKPAQKRARSSEEKEPGIPGPAVTYQEPDGKGGMQKKIQIERIPDPGDPYEGGEPPPENKVKPFTKDPNWSEDVIDRDEHMEPEAFYYLIHRVATWQQKDIEDRVDTRIDSNHIFRSPARLRGTAMRIRGTLIALREKAFEENRSGIRSAFVGQMYDNHNQVLSFYLLDLPEEASTWKPFKTVIEVKGLFYKIWKYRNKQNVFIESPLIIARTGRKIEKYPSHPPINLFGVDLVIGRRNVTWAEIIICLLVIVMVPTLFFLVRAERKKFESFKRAQTQKKRNAAKGIKPAKSDGAAPADGAPPAEGAAAPAGDAPPPTEPPPGDAKAAEEPTPPEEKPPASSEPPPKAPEGGDPSSYV
ncbi:MAG: hypothetical protein ACYS47_11775 [Planctomycetota bacterium]